MRKENNFERDIQIDIYRGLMMIYVPCIVHVFYWLQLIGEPWRSFVLFEMPVIFFISGATMWVTGKERSTWGAVKNRFQRLMLPYYFYAMAMFLVYILFWRQFFPGHSNTDIITGLLLIQYDSIPNGEMLHVWFIIPYFIVSCSFSIQKKWADKINRWCYMSILLLSCMAASGLVIFTNPSRYYAELILEPIYYNFFFIAGYLFYKQTTFKTLLWVSSLSLFTSISLYLLDYYIHGDFIGLQVHKFPPDLLFLSTGIFAISLLSLIFGRVTLRQNRIIGYWNKHGYTLYLWQNVSFLIYYEIATWLNLYPRIGDNHIMAIIASLLIFVLSTLSSLVIIPLEKAWIRLFHFSGKQKI